MKDGYTLVTAKFSTVQLSAAVV